MVLALSAVVLAQPADGIFPYPNPNLTPGVQSANHGQTWTFRTQSDNADARILIDSQGTYEGASPYGVAELLLRAQDEVHHPNGSVWHSADVYGRIRLMPYSFAWPMTGDPTTKSCWGTQCGGMMEFYSDADLRFTSAGGGFIDFVTNNRRRLLLNQAGELYYLSVVDPSYGPPSGPKLYACIVPSGTNKGQVVGQPYPCDWQ